MAGFNFTPDGPAGFDFQPDQPIRAEDPRSVTRLRLGAGADNYQAGLYGVGEAVAGAVGLKGVEDWARRGREDNELEANTQLRNASRKGAIGSWDEVQGVGDFANYAGGLLAQSLPYAGEFIAGGVVARGLSSGLRAAVNGGKAVDASMDAANAARAAQKALDTRSVIGGVAASYPSAVGDILQNQREESGTTNLGAAAGLGVPYAGLNALGFGSTLAKGGLARNTVNLLDDATGWRGAAARTGAAVGRNAVEEAINETGQEMVNQAGRIAVNPDAEMFSPEALARYKEAGIGGATVGGMFGGAGGWRQSSAYLQRQEDAIRMAAREARALADEQSRQPQDLLQLPLDTRVSSARNGVYDPNPIVVYPDGSTALRSEANEDIQFQARVGGLPALGETLSPLARTAAVMPDDGAAGSPVQAVVDQATGVARQPYAGPDYESQFEAAAQESIGRQVARADAGQLEDQVTRLEEAQRDAGILAAERADLVARQEKIKAEKDRLEQVKARAAFFGTPTSQKGVELLDALEQRYGVNGVNNKEAFDEQVTNLATGAPAKVKAHLGLTAKKETKPNVGAQAVSGPQPVASGAAGGADAQGSVAPAGRDAAAVDTGAGVSAGVQAPAGEVAVQSDGKAGAPAAPVKSSRELRVPEVRVLRTTDGGEQVLGLQMAGKTIELKARFMSRFLAAAGFNKDGSFSGRVRSADEAAQYLRDNGGDGHKTAVTRDDINNALKKVGLTPEALEQAMQTSDGSWMDRAVVADGNETTDPQTSDNATYAATAQSDEGGGPTGLRVAGSAAEINADKLIQPGQTAKQKQLDKEASVAIATAPEKRATERRVARQKAVAEGRERQQRERNEDLMAARRTAVMQDERLADERNNARADWENDAEFDALPPHLQAEYYLEYIALVDQLNRAEITDSRFLADVGRAKQEIQREANKSRREAQAGEGVGGQSERLGRDGPGSSGAAGLRARNAAQGPVEDVEPKQPGRAKFSKAEQRGPVPVEVNVGGQTLQFKDAQAAIARLQDKIARHESLLRCLRKG